jgi:polyisoprenoid-binding protein YceI
MNTHRIARFVPQFALALALVGTAACKSEVDQKPAAKVEEAGKKAEEPAKDDKAPAPAAVDLTLDKASSKLGFIGAKVTADHPGSFGDFSGTAKVAEGKVQSLEVVAEMKSLTADSPDLATHLQSADFFDVEKFPQAKFSALEITEKPGEGGATHEIAGNLEMHGQTKKITFPATITVNESEVHGKAEFKIDRNEWGISYAGMKDDLIKAEVALILDLHFKRA